MLDEGGNEMIQKFHNYIKSNADYRNENSPAYKFRRKRMDVFESQFVKWFGEKGDIVRILDIGGTLSFWTLLDFKYIDRVHITLLNLEKVEIPDKLKDTFISISGDGTNLSQYKDGSFDLVFSNSVIEHVGDFEAQKRMLSEMKRLSNRRYMQTPNRYFPIEPHYGFPLFQFFPMKMKMYLLQHYNIRCRKAESTQEAYKIASEVRLLGKRELKKLLPSEHIEKEKVFGLTKSFYIFF